MVRVVRLVRVVVRRSTNVLNVSTCVQIPSNVIFSLMPCKCIMCNVPT